MKTDKTDNEIIAEFYDGTTFDENGFCTDPSKKYSWRLGCYDPLEIKHLRYHESWDWLMPVVEKIGYLKGKHSIELGVFHNPVSIRFSGCEIYMDDGKIIVNYIGLSLIECTYKAVVEFIKWYNNQQSK